METGRVKRYVQVNADFMPDGTVRPHSVTLDGREFLIDRVVKVEDTNKGKETSLFLEKSDGMWERKYRFKTHERQRCGAIDEKPE